MAAAGGCGQAASVDAVSESSAALSTPDAPEYVPGTRPVDFRIQRTLVDATLPSVDPTGAPLVFDCYGSCGASCALHDGDTFTKTHCRALPEGQLLLADYTHHTGYAHAFCEFHDECYLHCNAAFVWGSSDAQWCRSYCDFACVEPEDWTRGRLMNEKLGVKSWSRYRAVEPASLVPTPRTWSNAMCATWAIKGAGAADVGSRPEGVVATDYTQLNAGTARVEAGNTCPPSTAPLPAL